MLPTTPCPDCGNDVALAPPDHSGLVRCAFCRTEFIPVPAEQDAPPAESSSSLPVAESASPAVWSWAEDGGPVDSLLAGGPILISDSHEPASAPAIEVELPAVVEGAVGPYLAFSAEDRSTLASRDRTRMGRRSTRREPGLLSHLVGVVGGGMLGLVIAYYLLNWIGGPKYNFLDLSLPGLARSETAAEEDLTAADALAEQQFAARPPSGRLMFDEESVEDEQADTDTQAADSLPAASETPTSSPADTAIGKLPLGVLNAPKFTSDQLRAALHATQDSATMTPEAFGQLCRLGQVVTYLDDQQDPQVEQRLKAIGLLAEKIDSRPGAVAQLSKFAVQRIREHGGPPAGIVLVGTVTETGQQGRLHWYRFALDGSDDTATVVARLPAAIVPGDHVLVFGSLVNDPVNNLAGYEGQLPQVVWGGWHAKLSPVKEQ